MYKALLKNRTCIVAIWLTGQGVCNFVSVIKVYVMKFAPFHHDAERNTILMIPSKFLKIGRYNMQSYYFGLFPSSGLPGLRLAQPSGPTNRFSVRFLRFYLKSKQNAASET